jgi:hypothetical protein
MHRHTNESEGHYEPGFPKYRHMMIVPSFLKSWACFQHIVQAGMLHVLAQFADNETTLHTPAAILSGSLIANRSQVQRWLHACQQASRSTNQKRAAILWQLYPHHQSASEADTPPLSLLHTFSQLLCAVAVHMVPLSMQVGRKDGSPDSCRARVRSTRTAGLFPAILALCKTTCFLGAVCRPGAPIVPPGIFPYT